MKAIVVHQPGPPEVRNPHTWYTTRMVVSESAGGRRQPVGNIHTSGAFPHRYLPANIGN